MRAEHWGVIHILENYSEALKQRLTGMKDLALAQLVGLGGGGWGGSNDTVYNSTIHVYLDMTNQQVGFTIQMKLAETFQAYGSSALSDCNIPKNITSLPIQFETPVYGSNDPTFTEFMAPGVILSITYFMAVGLTSISFIIERKEGLLDRSWIAGVTSLEVMLAHVVAQFVVMVVQVSFVLVFMLLVFQVRRELLMLAVMSDVSLAVRCRPEVRWSGWSVSPSSRASVAWPSASWSPLSVITSRTLFSWPWAASTPTSFSPASSGPWRGCRSISGIGRELEG